MQEEDQEDPSDSESIQDDTVGCLHDNKMETALATGDANVFMQTALTKAYNPDTEKVVFIRVFLDTAASRSFISQKVMDVLGLKTEKLEPSFMAGVLDSKRKKVQLKVTSIDLGTINGQRSRVQVRVL